jgi:hypothetical protein
MGPRLAERAEKHGKGSAGVESCLRFYQTFAKHRGSLRYQDKQLISLSYSHNAQ